MRFISANAPMCVLVVATLLAGGADLARAQQATISGTVT